MFILLLQNIFFEGGGDCEIVNEKVFGFSFHGLHTSGTSHAHGLQSTAAVGCVPEFFEWTPLLQLTFNAGGVGTFSRHPLLSQVARECNGRKEACSQFGMTQPIPPPSKDIYLIFSMETFDPFEGGNPELDFFRKKIRSAQKGFKELDNTVAKIQSTELGESELKVWQELERLYSEAIWNLDLFFQSSSIDDRNAVEKVNNKINEFATHPPQTSANSSQSFFYEWIRNRLTSLSGAISFILSDLCSPEEAREQFEQIQTDKNSLFS